MNLKRKSFIAGVILATIIIPSATDISFANIENKRNEQFRNFDYRIITGNSVNFRKGAGTKYDSIGKLNKGYKVQYLESIGSWVKVKYNSTEGFVYGDYVSDSLHGGEDTTVKEEKKVTGSRVNFRTGPGTNYSIIKSLSKGTNVGVISKSNGWSKINYNGKIGYMSSSYLGKENLDTNIKEEKKVIGSRVNFRTGPGTNYSIIKSLSKGTNVGVISKSNGWSKINYNGKIGYMSSSYLGTLGEGGGYTQSADTVIKSAMQHLGKSYLWGAEGPNSFDCSGFTQYVFKNVVGINLPRVSREQSKFGTAVSKSNLQKGDLLFFDTDRNGSVNHVGIYISNNEFIHASSGARKVVISQLNSFYNSTYINARRVL